MIPTMHGQMPGARHATRRARATGGEWIDGALEHLQPKVLCGACYDVAKNFHMGGDPFS
jgi:hypothetical protein